MNTNKKTRNIIIVLIIIAIFASIIAYFLTAPLHSVYSNGFTFLKMSDGTYCVKEYSGTNSYVEIPKTVRGVKVTEIRSYAFKNNTYIKTVVIPNSVVKIGESAFIGCTSIRTLIVPFIGGSNDHNTSLDYIFDGNTGLVTSVPASLKEVYITKGCTQISVRAFYLCNSITEIHIPSTVTKIEDGSGLTSVGVNDNMPTSQEKWLPFYGCSENLKIYCSTSKKPDGWGDYWNYTDNSNKAMVFWSSKEY